MPIQRLSFSALLAAVVMLTTAAASHADRSFFMGLGDLPDELQTASALLSRDGSTIFTIGMPTLTGGARRLFRWTADTGVAELSGGPASLEFPMYISGDGDTLIAKEHPDRNHRWTESAGWTAIASSREARGLSDDGSVAIYAGNERWTDAGLFDLGTLAGSDFAESESHAISANGSVIIGNAWEGQGVERAFRWTAATGKINIAANIAHDTSATAMSADGSVIAGKVQTTNGRLIFRWTAESGAQVIGTPPVDPTLGWRVPFTAREFGPTVSDDGSVIVAPEDSSGNGDYFRWTADTGWRPLGLESASRMTADGSLIVGSRRESGVTNFYLWDETRGAQPVREVLVNDFGLGQSIASWGRLSVSGISADGLFLAGTGVNPDGNREAWVAHLGEPVPEPSSFLLAACPAAALVLRARSRSILRRAP